MPATSMSIPTTTTSEARESNGDRIHIVDPNLRQGFAQLPRLVLRASMISDKAKIVYALLLDYAWQQGSCFPGQQRLARDLHTTERTIRRALEELRRCKLIDWKRRGLSQTNIYFILSLAENPNLASPEADRTILTAQQWTELSGQNRTPVSDKEDSDERHVDVNLRNSKGNASEAKGRTIAPQQSLQTEPYHTIQRQIAPAFSVSPHRRGQAGFAAIGQMLTQSVLVNQARAPVSSCRRPSVDPVSDQLASCIQDICNEFGDTQHLRSNLTQAQRLLRQSGLLEAAFVVRLYDARAITKDRRFSPAGGSHGVIKPMAYFWTVVRDQLALSGSRSVPDALDGPMEQGRGDE